MTLQKRLHQFSDIELIWIICSEFHETHLFKAFSQYLYDSGVIGSEFVGLIEVWESQVENQFGQLYCKLWILVVDELDEVGQNYVHLAGGVQENVLKTDIGEAVLGCNVHLLIQTLQKWWSQTL